MGTGAAIAMGVTSLTGAYSQAQAIRSQDQYQRMQNEANRRLSDMAAEEALSKSNLAVGKVKAQASRIQGAQKAAFVGQGVEASSGSAQAIQDETADYADIDIQTIKNNAWRQAWGYRVEAQQAAAQSRFRSQAARQEATNTLITGGIKALGSFAIAKQYYDENKLTEVQAAKLEFDKKMNAKTATEVGKSGLGRLDLTSNDPQDSTARDLASSQYGKDWRKRSRINPIFGNTMTNSWFVS